MRLVVISEMRLAETRLIQMAEMRLISVINYY